MSVNIILRIFNPTICWSEDWHLTSLYQCVHPALELEWEHHHSVFASHISYRAGTAPCECNGLLHKTALLVYLNSAYIAIMFWEIFRTDVSHPASLSVVRELNLNIYGLVVYRYPCLSSSPMAPFKIPEFQDLTMRLCLKWGEQIKHQKCLFLFTDCKGTLDR